MKKQMFVVALGLSLLTSTASAAKFYADVKSPFGEDFYTEWCNARDALAKKHGDTVVQTESMKADLFACQTDQCAMDIMKSKGYQAVIVQDVKMKKDVLEVTTIGFGLPDKAKQVVKEIDPKNLPEAISMMMKEVEPFMVRPVVKPAAKPVQQVTKTAPVVDKYEFLFDKQNCCQKEPEKNTEKAPVVKQSKYGVDEIDLDSILGDDFETRERLPNGDPNLTTFEKIKLKAAILGYIMKEVGSFASEALDEVFN